MSVNGVRHSASAVKCLGDTPTTQTNQSAPLTFPVSFNLVKFSHWNQKPWYPLATEKNSWIRSESSASVGKRNPCQRIASGIDQVLFSYSGLDACQFEDGRELWWTLILRWTALLSSPSRRMIELEVDQPRGILMRPPIRLSRCVRPQTCSTEDPLHEYHQDEGRAAVPQLKQVVLKCQSNAVQQRSRKFFWSESNRFVFKWIR